MLFFLNASLLIFIFVSNWFENKIEINPKSLQALLPILSIKVLLKSNDFKTKLL